MSFGFPVGARGVRCWSAASRRAPRRRSPRLGALAIDVPRQQDGLRKRTSSAKHREAAPRLPAAGLVTSRGDRRLEAERLAVSESVGRLRSPRRRVRRPRSPPASLGVGHRRRRLRRVRPSELHQLSACSLKFDAVRFFIGAYALLRRLPRRSIVLVLPSRLSSIAISVSSERSSLRWRLQQVGRRDRTLRRPDWRCARSFSTWRAAAPKGKRRGHHAFAAGRRARVDRWGAGGRVVRASDPGEADRVRLGPQLSRVKSISGILATAPRQGQHDAPDQRRRGAGV